MDAVVVFLETERRCCCCCGAPALAVMPLRLLLRKETSVALRVRFEPMLEAAVADVVLCSCEGLKSAVALAL